MWSQSPAPHGTDPEVWTTSGQSFLASISNRDVVERLWARLGERRAVATCYQKIAWFFTGVLCFTATLDWNKR
jgi:hypothetical protein